MRQETRVLVLCKKCKGFIGELSNDGPTSGECLRVNSSSIRYCDVHYVGVDTTFAQLEAQDGEDEDLFDDETGELDGEIDEDEAMYLGEEEVARRRAAAAWRRTGGSGARRKNPQASSSINF